jgi:putrescine transport system substrate-binding protein
MAVDMLGIPADAPHPQNALRFIDYLLRPQVIADISDAVNYPNPNIPGTALVNPAIRDDPAVYPPADVRRRFFVDLPAPSDYERARTRAWTRLKSGE